MADETIDITPEMVRRFYSPFCTESEMDRIISPQTASDNLLGLRANYIGEHMRVFRYFRRQRQRLGLEYSLEACFSTEHYENYLEQVSEEDRRRLQGVCYGDVYTAEADGQIFATPFGPIVTISGSLRHFLEFGHVALGAFYIEVPLDVRFRALVIALRVMFGYESLDFDADPRGNIDAVMKDQMEDSINLQMEFIAGHEFAHYLLGHLSDNKTYSVQRRAAVGGHSGPSFAYSTSQQQEFDADLDALTRPQMSSERRGVMINSTCMWFGMVELYEHAREIISPMPAWKRSHPTARDRHLRIQEALKYYLPDEFIDNSARLLRFVDYMREHLTEYLSLHIEVFEHYGSIYLSDEPNTEWRGPLKVDRIDY
jgi:hypothetical protein